MCIIATTIIHACLTSSLMLTLAPLSSNSVTMSAFPLAAATCSGVYPDRRRC